MAGKTRNSELSPEAWKQRRDEILEETLYECDILGRVPSRRAWTHNDTINFAEMVEFLGKGSYVRAEQMITLAWMKRQSDMKKLSEEQGKKNVQSPKVVTEPGKAQDQRVENQEMKKGGKVVEEAKVEEIRSEEKLEKVSEKGLETAKAQEAPEQTSEKPLEGVSAGTPALEDTPGEIPAEMSAPEQVPEKALTPEKTSGEVSEKAAEKTPRKTVVRMSKEQMREFVLRAIEVLGDEPTKMQYDNYIAEYGGPTTATLSKHGFGISQWPVIAAIEREKAKAAEAQELEWERKEAEARELERRQQEEAEKMLNDPVRAEVESETALQSESGVQSATEVQSDPEAGPDETKEEAERGLDLSQILQVMVNGVDATVMLGDLQMRVRIDFGSK